MLPLPVRYTGPVSMLHGLARLSRVTLLPDVASTRSRVSFVALHLALCWHFVLESQTIGLQLLGSDRCW